MLRAICRHHLLRLDAVLGLEPAGAAKCPAGLHMGSSRSGELAHLRHHDQSRDTMLRQQQKQSKQPNSHPFCGSVLGSHRGRELAFLWAFKRRRAVVLGLGHHDQAAVSGVRPDVDCHCRRRIELLRDRQHGRDSVLRQRKPSRQHAAGLQRPGPLGGAAVGSDICWQQIQLWNDQRGWSDVLGAQ